MKKYIIYILFLAALSWSCGKNTQSTANEHDKENVNEDHNHEDHDHDHDEAHDHSHDDHAHGEGDEIILTPEQAQIIGLETEKVKLATFNQVIKTSGQVIAAQGDERTIVATISGVVSFAKADANEGKAVNKGESLFKISASHLAEGDPVMKARSAYEMAKRNFERAEQLIGDKLVSQKEYNDLKLVYENAQITYNAISGGGRSSGANILSPIAGYIKSKLVAEGQFVNVGDPLMVVTQNSKLQLRADVSERYYKDLPNIRTANFKTPYDDSVYKLADMAGQLLSYGKSSNDTEFYIPVNFQFNNIVNVIPGSYVEVYLISGTKENTISIPNTSLIDEQGLFFVYCKLNEEEYERREVEIGTSDGDRTEILSGLKAEDEVVTKGAFHVKLASASEAIPHGHAH